MPQPKPLTEAQQEEAINEYLSEVRRDLIVRGEDPDSTFAREAIANIRPYLTATATSAGGANVRYWDRNVSPRLFADRVVEDIRDREELASYGPDPRPLLADRLMKLGLSSAEAHAYAAQRISRRQDGGVEAFASDGSVLTSYLKLNNPTEEQLAAMRDPSRALEAATRAILEERERAENPPSSVDHRFAIANAF